MSALADGRRTAAEVGGGGREGSGGGLGLTGLAWLTWRQHRWAVLGIVVPTLVMAAWGAYLGASMNSLYGQCGYQPCSATSTQYATLNRAFGLLQLSDYVLHFALFMPMLFGMFLGAPVLAREHEQRTLLLAWSQDVSPARWLWTKLALLGALVAASAAIMSAEAQHLAQVRITVGGGTMFSGTEFMISGMLPLVVSVVWFAVGVALGALIRRMLPAAAIALFGFIGLTLLVQWRYPTLMKPLALFAPIPPAEVKFGEAAKLGANALVVAQPGFRIGPGFFSGFYTSSGSPVTFDQMQQACPNFEYAPGDLYPCAAAHHMDFLTQYQPGSRIPQFHLIVMGGYAAIGVLAVLLVWLAARRTSLSAG
jgi:ABC-2 family transporter